MIYRRGDSSRWSFESLCLPDMRRTLPAKDMHSSEMSTQSSMHRDSYIRGSLQLAWPKVPLTNILQARILQPTGCSKHWLHAIIVLVLRCSGTTEVDDGSIPPLGRYLEISGSFVIAVL